MKLRLPIFTTLCLILFAVVSLAGSDPQGIGSSSTEATSLLGLSLSIWEKIIVAVVSAMLSFLGAMLLERYKKKREPRKLISYEKILHKGIVAVDDEIRGKTAVLYRDTELKDPYRLCFKFENSGNSLIKGQYIRFKFPDGCNVVDTYLAPMPEPELGFEEIKDPTLGTQEKKFKISHFEIGRSVNLRFVLSGSLDKDVEMHPFNEEGGVTIIERTAAQALTDSDKLTRFLWLVFLLWILPKLFYIIPIIKIADLGAGILRLGIAIFLLPLLNPVVRIIADRFIRIGGVAQEGASVQVRGIESGATVQIAIDRR